MMVTMYRQWYDHRNVWEYADIQLYTLAAYCDWIKTYMRNCSLTHIISDCPVISAWGFLVDPVSVTTSPNVWWQTSCLHWWSAQKIVKDGIHALWTVLISVNLLSCATVHGAADVS